jgi:EAL domain-containing protein (putative c-di-GMP-specific phosphodiesterase class I)
LAIDDFGDGWATTASVVLVEPEIVKVRLARLLEGTTAQVVRQHAEVLGASVVVEQVETAEDLAMVRALGFSHGQGWYWDEVGRAAAVVDVR